MYGWERTVIKCCWQCQDRALNCHSKCERYLEESARHRKLKSEYNGGKDYRGYTRLSILNVRDKVAKRKKKNVKNPINH